MNDRTGLCVPKDGSYDPAWGTGVGAGWYRFTGDLDNGAPREWAQACVDAGLKLFLTYDSDTFRNRTDEEAVQGLVERYGGLISIVGNGNEVDGTGPESSTMTHARCNRLMEISRYYWGDDQLLAAPSLITGDESWYDGFDFTHCNLIDVHWYGIWAPDTTPRGPFFGRLPDTIERHVQKARQVAGRFIPVVSSESGLSTWEVPEDVQADYVGSSVSYLVTETALVVMHAIFAFHDHAGFGIIHNDGRWKPACYAYMAAANGYWTPELQSMQLAMRSRATDEAAQWRGKAAA